MWFNADTTAEGVEALRRYRTEYDERLKTFADIFDRESDKDAAVDEIWAIYRRAEGPTIGGAGRRRRARSARRAKTGRHARQT
jgi:hypothetical protein